MGVNEGYWETHVESKVGIPQPVSKTNLAGMLFCNVTGIKRLGISSLNSKGICFSFSLLLALQLICDSINSNMSRYVPPPSNLHISLFLRRVLEMSFFFDLMAEIFSYYKAVFVR